MSQTLLFLQENNLTNYAELEKKTTQSTADFHDLSDKIRTKEKRLSEISALQRYIGNYSRTKDIYAQYRKAGYNKKFYAEHEGDIILHKASKKYFDELNLQKLPPMQSLKQEYATLSSEKKKLYVEYRQAKENMKKFQIIKSNTDEILDVRVPTQRQDLEL
jgi:hypothetical protein